MKIGIIGAGRLGITFALLCEKAGYNVIVSDIREDYVSKLNQKVCDTNEPLISELLYNVTNFEATIDNLKVINESDIIFTFVSTPSTVDGKYDVTSVWEVVDDFIKANESKIELNNKYFVVGCTTNPGDVEKFQIKLNSISVKVAYNPEFIAQGEIVKGLEQSDIVLIGTHHEDLTRNLLKIYNDIQIVQINPQIMSPTAAEITKIGINCFLTTKISYANMIGEILLNSGLEPEIDTVLKAIGSDSRIGGKYMKFGFGFGGPCLPRDNRALGYYSEIIGMNLNLPITVDKFNKEHSEFLKNFYLKQNPNRNIPFIMDYVSYKKGTDILEESQQLQLCIDFLNEGYKVIVLESDKLRKQLEELSNKYDGKLLLTNSLTGVEGYKIDLL